MFDVEYASKVFTQFKLFAPQAFTLALMDKYDEAVALSLEIDRIDLAQKIARRALGDKLKKQLWLKIFVFVLSKNGNNIEASLETMKDSDTLEIEDVLPHIMDNIKIEMFKREISSCINNYEDNIDKLQKEIRLYNETAEKIKRDIRTVRKKHIELRYKQCICEICQNNIKEDEVYIFPCGHMFDSVAK